MTYDPGVIGALGTKIYIGTTASSGAADTYLEIKNVESISTFGRNYTIVKFTALSDGAVQKFKGEFDDGDIKVGVGRDVGDPGQAACVAARDYTGAAYYNFKIVFNDQSTATAAHGTKFLFKGKVTAFTTTIGTTQSPVKGELTVAIKSGSIQETAAA